MVLGGSNTDGVIIRIRGDNSDFIAALNQAKIAAAAAVASIKATMNTGTIGAAMTSSMTSASASLNNVSASLRNVSGSLGSVGSSFTTLGLVGSAAAYAVSGSLLDAVETGGKFEMQMKGVEAVLGQIGDSPAPATMKQLTDYAKELGSSTIFNPIEVAEGMQIFAQAGYDNEKIMKAILPTIELATSQEYDLADSIDIVVTSLNAMDYGVDQITRVTNVYAAATSATTATMTDLHYGLKYILPSYDF